MRRTRVKKEARKCLFSDRNKRVAPVWKQERSNQDLAGRLKQKGLAVMIGYCGGCPISILGMHMICIACIN